MNLSVLVHTFDQYRHLWHGCASGVVQYFPDDIPCYWGTDIKPTPGEAHYAGELILSGLGEWSDRLTRLLLQVPTDYVLYMQEDHWPKQSPPDLSEMMKIISENNLLRLQISPVVQFYKLNGSGELLFFDPSSKYLVSHQPSIWKKSFFLDCLKTGETPWQNEYEGTKRIKNDPKIHKKIAIYPCDWYKHMCIKGKVVKS